MPIMRLGDQIRLTGKDAEMYLLLTGNSHLPNSIHEYQFALEQAALSYEGICSPEGDLLAFFVRADQIIEENGNLIKTIDSKNPDRTLAHLLNPLYNESEGGNLA